MSIKRWYGMPTSLVQCTISAKYLPICKHLQSVTFHEHVYLASADTAIEISLRALTLNSAVMKPTLIHSSATKD